LINSDEEKRVKNRGFLLFGIMKKKGVAVFVLDILLLKLFSAYFTSQNFNAAFVGFNPFLMIMIALTKNSKPLLAFL